VWCNDCTNYADNFHSDSLKFHATCNSEELLPYFVLTVCCDISPLVEGVM